MRCVPTKVPDPRDMREWLGWIVAERSGRLVRYAARVRYEGDPSGPADLIHDAMLKILVEEVDLTGDPQKAWLRLLTIIKNVARNGNRTAKVRQTVPLDALRAPPGRLRDARERGWRICERLEREEALEAALACLTADQREVVELRYFEMWTNGEIAKHRGVSTSAVKHLLRKALAKLEAKLDGRYGAT